MTDTVRTLKAMTAIMNPSAVANPIFKGVKMPYKRSKEVRKRAHYKLDEAKLRVDVIKELKKQGFVVKRIETLASGIPDLVVMHLGGGWGGFIELKTPIGVMSDEQLRFKDLCALNKVNHMVVRSVEDVKDILNFC